MLTLESSFFTVHVVLMCIILVTQLSRFHSSRLFDDIPVFLYMPVVCTIDHVLHLIHVRHNHRHYAQYKIYGYNTRSVLNLRRLVIYGVYFAISLKTRSRGLLLVGEIFSLLLWVLISVKNDYSCHLRNVFIYNFIYVMPSVNDDD